MMSFILFFPILTKVGNVFAVPTTDGEVTIKVIEDIVEGEQELTNDIFQDFDKVDCLFFQKENSIGNCKSTEWGILLLLVINGLIYIQFLSNSFIGFAINAVVIVPNPMMKTLKKLL